MSWDTLPKDNLEYLLSKLKTDVLDNKVDTEAGKGLSSNDYTTADKTKLDGISTGANKVESSETNGNIKIDTVETQVYDDTEIQEVIDTSLTETDYANPLSLETMQAQTAKNTKIKLDPIQDLHGYDKPWVGGAGKNKLLLTVDGIKAANTSGTWSGNAYTLSQVTFTILTDSDNNVIGINVNGTPNGGNVNFRLNQVYDIPQGNYILSDGMSQHSNNFNLTTFKNDSWVAATNRSDNVAFTVDSDGDIRQVIYVANGTSVNNVVVYPMIRLSDASAGFASYTNLCPITGRSEIDILGCGKNLINISSKTLAGEGYIVQDFAWSISEGTYTLSFNSSVQSGNWLIVGKNASNVEVLRGGNTVGQPFTFTLSDSVATINIYVNVGGTFSEFQLEEDSTATEYEPYTISNNLSIDLPSTVYGGVLDLESGELVVDKEICKVSDLTWLIQSNSQYGKFKSWSLSSKIYKTTTEAIAISEYYQSKSDQAAILYNDQIYSNGSGDLKIRDSRYIDDADATAWIAACGNCKIVYRLADSAKYTLHLTPYQLSLLKAQNNLTTSQYTQIKVTYRNGVFATLEPVSENNDGLMSRLDKVKLDSISDDATKTESSTTNGNIKINGTETQVYDDSEIKGELSTDTTTIEGNPINFSTLSAQTAKSTILSVEPIQDLHGFTKPWVGGAGKNKLPLTLADIKSANTSGTWNGNVYTKNGMTITVLVDSDNNVIGISNSANTPSATFDFRVYEYTGGDLPFDITKSYTLSGCPNGGSGSTYKEDIIYYDQNDIAHNLLSIYGTEGSVSFSVLEDATKVYVRLIFYAVSQTAKTWYPMIRLSTESDATFHPYTNECPISGRSEIGILGCGVNENDTSKLAILYNSSNTRIRQNLSMFRVKKGDKVTISFNNNNLQAAFLISSSVQTDLTRFPTTQYPDSDSGWQNSGYTYTCNYDGWISLGYRKNDNSTISVQDIIDANVQIELGSQPTQYTAYQSSNDVTIAFGQTVYGGTLDVENGVLVVDRGYKTYNGSEVNTYTLLSSGRVNIDDATLGYYKQINKKYEISNLYEVVTQQTDNASFNWAASNKVSALDFSANPSSTTFTIRIKDPRFTDLNTAMSILANSPLEVCYKLATPITINLTPHTINLLKGVNNISTDGDKITLTYRDGSVATLGDLTSAVDNLDSKIDESKILTDTATGDKYILVVTNGVLSVEQISN